jgi:homoserine dehydrogenase
MIRKIALIGCGVVGQGLLEIFEQKRQEFADTYGFEAMVVAISDMKKGAVLCESGLDLSRVITMLKTGISLTEYQESGKTVTPGLSPLDTIRQTSAEMVVEITYTDIKTGEPATSHIREALSRGKHVITSNKGPAALHYQELKALAKAHNVCLGIEGTVMSGTPVFNLVDRCLHGCNITEINGILNGTTNFMLTKMENDQMEYNDVLKLAQELGYAEADPTADVGGFDAMAKVIILANVIMGGSLTTKDVSCQGITAITKTEVEKAKREGQRYKLIGNIKKAADGSISASVSPRKLPLTDPLAGVAMATNALTFTTDLMGKVTIQGAGAGKTETGFSILTDILAIHRQSAR